MRSAGQVNVPVSQGLGPLVFVPLRILLHQEGCVENSAASVEMPADTPAVFTQIRIFAALRLFDSVTSQTICFGPFLALRMLLDK